MIAVGPAVAPEATVNVIIAIVPLAVVKIGGFVPLVAAMVIWPPVPPEFELNVKAVPAPDVKSDPLTTVNDENSAVSYERGDAERG